MYSYKKNDTLDYGWAMYDLRSENDRPANVYKNQVDSGPLKVKPLLASM